MLRVMLVDDSATVRGLISRILSSESDIEVVQTVPNGEMAISSAAELKPDLVILDIEMPVMDGLTALPKILAASPRSKIIMCSTLTRQNADVTIKALSLGAADYVLKPSSREISGGDDFRASIIQKVRSICGLPQTAPRVGAGHSLPVAAPAPASPGPAPSKAGFALRPAPVLPGKPDLIAIGSSTGGPQALFQVLKHLKGVTVPIVITQHMPPTFTTILAQHIEQQTEIPCHEASDGEALQNGVILVAPGGKHLVLREDKGLVSAYLDDGPPENFCKPAVDPMFRSAVQIFGKRMFGLILTGMGSDGLGGGRALVDAGGQLIAQDEKTSVVWGMPGAVANAGLCSAVLPLDEIGPYVRKRAGLL